MKKQADTGLVHKKPNILFILVDQMQYPRYSEGGFAKGISDILGFKPMTDGIESQYQENYPGFMALRKNAVVLKNHRIATSACVPSRTALFTGQYGTRNGSCQTDGIFKSGTDKEFPWMPADEMPTIGSYMRLGGYRSYYFGKWHISGEETSNLEDYGFSQWELSYPDPHGYLPNNLGYYRDYQFRDLATSFLRREGIAQSYNVAHAQYNAGLTSQEPEPPAPWFAVCSFANPHDIASYPGLPAQVYDKQVKGKNYTLAVPRKNQESNVSTCGTMPLTLNKTGLGQHNSQAAPTWQENTRENNKPDCQFDYSYKMGLALAATPVLNAIEDATPDQLIEHELTQSKRQEQLNEAIDQTIGLSKSGVPLAMTDDPELACTAFMQYYAYLISEVDKHIKSVLDALDESGQADNTIVIFCADHGEYAGAHNKLTEKWSTGYDEVVHVPMVVRFPQGYEAMTDPEGVNPRQVEQVTSHIDLLPTILGLAGIDLEEQLTKLQQHKKKKQYTSLARPVGSDLSSLIKHSNPKAIADREGVLFINYDTITEPLNVKRAKARFEEGDITAYEVYCGAVEKLRLDVNSETQYLTSGSVRQPCYVHCVVNNEGWKLVRYFDRNDDGLDNQYELYDLNTDINERHNLVIYNKFPDVYQPNGCIPPRNDEIAGRAEELKTLMDTLEEEMLTPINKATPLV